MEFIAFCAYLILLFKLNKFVNFYHSNVNELHFQDPAIYESSLERQMRELHSVSLRKGSRPKKKIAYFETLSQRRGEGVQQNLIWKKNLIETQIKGEGGLAKF